MEITRATKVRKQVKRDYTTHFKPLLLANLMVPDASQKYRLKHVSFQQVVTV